MKTFDFMLEVEKGEGDNGSSASLPYEGKGHNLREALKDAEAQARKDGWTSINYAQVYCKACMRQVA